MGHDFHENGKTKNMTLDQQKEANTNCISYSMD